MERQLESSRTTSLLASLTRRTNRWGYIRAFGTPMTGRREAVLWRRIGAKRLSPPPTGTSTPIRRVSGPPVPRLAAQTITTPIPALSCSRKNWTPQAKKGSNGFKKITWFTIIVRTQNGSHKASHQNAQRPTNPRIEIILYLTFWRADLLILFVFLNLVC